MTLSWQRKTDVKYVKEWVATIIKWYWFIPMTSHYSQLRSIIRTKMWIQLLKFSRNLYYKTKSGNGIGKISWFFYKLLLLILWLALIWWQYPIAWLQQIDFKSSKHQLSMAKREKGEIFIMIWIAAMVLQRL